MENRYYKNEYWFQFALNEKGMRCKSATAHSTVMEDESQRPLPGNDSVGRGQVGMIPKSGDLPIEIRGKIFR